MNESIDKRDFKEAAPVKNILKKSNNSKPYNRYNNRNKRKPKDENSLPEDKNQSRKSEKPPAPPSRETPAATEKEAAEIKSRKNLRPPQNSPAAPKNEKKNRQNKKKPGKPVHVNNIAPDNGAAPIQPPAERENLTGEIYVEPETSLREYNPEDVNITETGNLNIPTGESGVSDEKIEIVGIRFKPVGKIYFFSPNEEQYAANEKIIVETSRGLELGYVVIPNRNINADKVVQPLKPVLRKATEDDIRKSEKNKSAAKETIKIANDRIKFHNLNEMKMKLIEAEYTFDNSKLIYYFTADGRVDFRELVKDLAAIFKTRIEMRQIGIRDQTKILGGLSICGRPFCCNSFLQDFAQVTIKMAKEQNMSINSAKISGACGRLMCCLKYEHEAYDYLNKDTPKVNSIVEASSGETGVVVESNILTGICKIKISQKNNAESADMIKPFPKKNLKVIGFVKKDQEHLYGAVGKDEKTDDLK